MHLTVKQKRDIAVGLIGYGFPESKLWLMGYEESSKGAWVDMTDKDLSIYKNGYTDDMTIEDLRSYRGTYRGYYKLISSLFPDYILEEKKIFVTNLLPFGKKDSLAELTPEACRFFGCENQQELYNITLTDRHFALLNFFEKHNWKDKYIFFCIGKSANKEVELKRFLSKLYDIPSEYLFHSVFHNVSFIPYIYRDNEFKKFITYHASSGKHFNKALNIITEILK